MEFFCSQSLFVGFSSVMTPTTQSLKENYGNYHAVASSQDVFMYSLTRPGKDKTPKEIELQYPFFFLSFIETSSNHHLKECL